MPARQRSSAERSIWKLVAGRHPGTVAVTRTRTGECFLSCLLFRPADEYNKCEAERLLPWWPMVKSPAVTAGLALLLARFWGMAEGVQEFTSVSGSIWRVMLQIFLYEMVNWPSLGTIQATLCRNVTTAWLCLTLPIKGKLTIIVSNVPYSLFTLLFTWDLSGNCFFWSYWWLAILSTTFAICRKW